MNLTKETRENNVTIIQLTGRIALGREPGNIETAVNSALSEGAKLVIVNLSAVTHIDSTGIGIMAYCFGKATQAGANFRISGAKGGVLEVFRITRLDRVVPFFPDVDSAVRGVGRLS